MLETYVPRALPPAHVVERIVPTAAEKIRAVNEYENGPAKFRRDGGVNAEDLREAAFDELGEVLVAALAEENAALLEALSEDVASLRARWTRMEEIRGLQFWMANGQRNYSPQLLPVLRVDASGDKQLIMGRRIFDSLTDVLAREGR